MRRQSNLSVEAKRIAIANERVTNALKSINADLKGYPIKFFELAYLNIEVKGKKVNERKRKRILSAILTGKAHPKYNEFITRLELFCAAVKKINRM